MLSPNYRGFRNVGNLKRRKVRLDYLRMRARHLFNSPIRLIFDRKRASVAISSCCLLAKVVRRYLDRIRCGDWEVSNSLPRNIQVRKRPIEGAQACERLAAIVVSKCQPRGQMQVSSC